MISSCTRNCSNARCFDSISSASFFASSGSASSPEGAEGNGHGAVWRRPHGSPDREATDGSAPVPAIGSTKREKRDRARTRKRGKGVEERVVVELECGRGAWCGRGCVGWGYPWPRIISDSDFFVFLFSFANFLGLSNSSLHAALANYGAFVEYAATSLG